MYLDRIKSAVSEGSIVYLGERKIEDLVNKHTKTALISGTYADVKFTGLRVNVTPYHPAYDIHVEERTSGILTTKINAVWNSDTNKVQIFSCPKGNQHSIKRLFKRIPQVEMNIRCDMIDGRSIYSGDCGLEYLTKHHKSGEYTMEQSSFNDDGDDEGGWHLIVDVRPLQYTNYVYELEIKERDIDGDNETFLTEITALWNSRNKMVTVISMETGELEGVIDELFRNPVKVVDVQDWFYSL